MNNFMVVNRKNKKTYTIDFKNEPAHINFSINANFYSSNFKYSKESMIQPFAIIEHNFENKVEKTLKEEKVLGKFNKNNYVYKRIYAKSRDNKNIPISIIYHKKT